MGRRRRRDIRRGTIQANRYEEMRADGSLAKINRWVLIVVVGLVAYAMIANALDGNDRSAGVATASSSTTMDREIAKPSCEVMRREWNRVTLDDFDRGEEIRERYISEGCYALCGDLVPHPDPAVPPETRCKDL